MKYLSARVPDPIEQDVLIISDTKEWTKSHTVRRILEDWFERWHKGEVEL